VYVNKDDLYVVDYQYTWWTILCLVYEEELGPETRALGRTLARSGDTSLVRYLIGGFGSGSTYSRKDSKDVGGKSSSLGSWISDRGSCDLCKI